MSTYTACAGSQQTAVNAHRVNVNGLGSKFSHMRGKTYGACPACGRTGLVIRANGTVPAHKAQEQTPAVAPITVDSTPAGIFAAMMRANATDAHGLVNVLAQYLRRTLQAQYGAVAGEHIHATAMNSGEMSDDVIAYGLESVQYGRTENVTMADLSVGDTVSTDVGPVLLTSNRVARVLSGRVQFIGRILSTDAVDDACTWILRDNITSGHAVDYWVCQGIDRRPMVRYTV